MKFRYIVLLCILIGCKTNSQDEHTDETDPIEISIKKHADSLLVIPEITAVSIGVYKDGKAYTKHFGELDRGKGNTPTDSTIYEIASVSKSFTGLLVAQAVLDKKLSLEDDIRDYLNEDYPNLEYNGNPIRIKHLMSHTSRLPRFLPTSINSLFENIDETLPFRIYEINQQYSKKKFLTDLLAVQIDTIPGITYEYSNADVELMAGILENIYGTSYESLIEKYITNVATMRDTKVNLTENQSERLANGYGETGKRTPHFANTLWGSSGGLKSTMSDLINYMEFQLDEYNSLVVESHRSIYRNEHLEIGYLIPIYNDEIDGKNYGIHGGAYGTQNWFAVIPKHNLGISIITNQSGPQTYGQLLRTMNAILGDIR
ncbi:serine hydrolase [Aureisphaera galaxeae]|uniref:serine hydrolase domain-containing protein n=1 Tax=Aureisphaera galaxeae TaxID=1538023 RepID=UPI0023500D6A|nr:serine hydrolase domain-containing protein [Aureisphaera galaxeae]MDC8003898.1 serine hydrolase [Aureisphaera galaxeae]